MSIRTLRGFTVSCWQPSPSSQRQFSAMVRTLTPDAPRLAFAIVIAAALIVLPSTGITQLSAIVIGAIAGRWLSPKELDDVKPATSRISAWPFVAIALFFALLALSFVSPPTSVLGEFTRFYAAGALVFGGGHVVLPLLQDRFVTPGLIDAKTFLAGYAVAQVIPGPLFTFAAFLGALVLPVRGVLGASIGLIGIFVPSALLLAAVVPTWQLLHANVAFRRALIGINAAVVGILERLSISLSSRVPFTTRATLQSRSSRSPGSTRLSFRRSWSSPAPHSSGVSSKARNRAGAFGVR